jgi:hypothetical protein
MGLSRSFPEQLDKARSGHFANSLALKCVATPGRKLLKVGHHLFREELEACLHGFDRRARRHQHHREELDRHFSRARLDMLYGVLRRDDRREPKRQDLFLVIEMGPRARTR